MAKKKNKKIVRYRRPLNIDVGKIILALVFLYMAFYVSTYFRRDKIEFYEVSEGGIVNDQRHTGIIFRNETVKYTDRAGNINYYLREGKRAAVGTRIYSIDETGALAELLAEQSGSDVSLSGENLAVLKKQLSTFSQSFQDSDFSLVYDTKYTLDSEVLEFVNVDTLKNLDSVVSEMGANFEQVRSDAAGIVSYAIDSMESLTPTQVTADMFSKENYSKTLIKSGQLVENGAPAYKLVTSEDWSVVFPLSEEEISLYSGRDSLPVKFTGGLETAAAFSMITGADGGTYGKLDFTKYMEQFISDRFVDFEIVTEEVRGLKIPRSSVTEENFYMIPKEFMVKSENGSNRGFYKETYGEDGTPSVVLVSATIYNTDEDYYYVGAWENSEFKAGDYIVKENSQDRYQIGATVSMQGVYNINKGYTVFKRIEILASNEEYYTIKKGSDYGLSVYDHIVLDADAVASEGTIIFQ